MGVVSCQFRCVLVLRIDSEAGSGTNSPVLPISDYPLPSPQYMEDAESVNSLTVPFVKLLERCSVDVMITMLNHADYLGKLNAALALAHLAMDSSCAEEVSRTVEM
jgi:hypothetical protein